MSKFGQFKMAEQQCIDSPKAETACGLCSKRMKKPKQLPCCHTFCRECLEDYVKDMLNPESETIDCPKCQKVVDVPDGDTKGLPSNYYILAKSLPEMINIESGDLTCDVCKSNKKTAVGYCFECSKNLCEADKEKHKTAEATRSHHIAVLMDKCQGKIEKQSYCSKHTDSVLKFYCCVCTIPICADCKLAKHENHETEDIADVAARDRERLSKFLEILRQYLPCMNEVVVRAENAEAAFKNHANDTIECINHRRDEVKKYVDILCDGAVNYVRGKLQAELQCMVPQLNDIREDRNFIQRSIGTTEPVLEYLGEDVKIVQVTKEIQHIVNNLPAPKSIDEKKFIFNAGTYNRTFMTNFVGTIGFEAKKIKLDYSFERISLLENSIIPVSETDTWMSYINTMGSYLSKLSRGKEVDTYAFREYSKYRVIPLGQEEFLLASKKDQKLKVWKDYKESDFAETPYAPRGMTRTADNHILVCCSSVDKIDDEWKSCILEFSQRGDLLRRVESFQEDDKKLFTAPRYICVNINGNVCISDQHGYAVVIFNKDFKLIGRYEGQNNPRPFRPRGICCDRFGRIIVTDGDNNKIHLLTHSGEFIRYILSEEDGLKNPVLVALGPGNKLWIGCIGVVHVYAYLDGAGLLSRPTSPQVRNMKKELAF